MLQRGIRFALNISYLCTSLWLYAIINSSKHLYFSHKRTDFALSRDNNRFASPVAPEYMYI